MSVFNLLIFALTDVPATRPTVRPVSFWQPGTERASPGSCVQGGISSEKLQFDLILSIFFQTFLLMHLVKVCGVFFPDKKHLLCVDLSLLPYFQALCFAHSNYLNLFLSCGDCKFGLLQFIVKISYIFCPSLRTASYS